jgi:hypothetical protein
MPFVLVETVEWDGKDYNLSIGELQQIVPHIKDGDLLTFSILEIRNEHNELVKRLKPLTRTHKTVSLNYTSHVIRRDLPPLSVKFSAYEASELNIGNNYKMAILITEHNHRSLFPFELRYGGYGTEEIVKSLGRIEASLLSITQPELQQAVNYLLEASMLYEDGRIEDTRAKLRLSLEALSKIRGKIKPVPGKEDEEFGRRLENLIKGIKGFVEYGGPHLGPAPKPTTDMVFNMIVELVKMLSHNIAEGNITIIGET